MVVYCGAGLDPDLVEDIHATCCSAGYEVSPVRGRQRTRRERLVPLGGRGERVLEIIKSRRSFRRFLDKPIPPEVLGMLLEAARWAPSGGNIQPWEFVVVQEPANLRKVKLFSPGLGGEPVALFILCSDQSAEASTAIMDVAIAAQNVMLVATDLELGSCVIRSHNQKALQTLLALPAHVLPELIVALGYPAIPGKNPGRRPLEELVHWEEWGGRPSE